MHVKRGTSISLTKRIIKKNGVNTGTKSDMRGEGNIDVTTKDN